MRTINTLDWQAGQLRSSKPVLLTVTPFARLFGLAWGVLNYTAQLVNVYLDSLDVSHETHSKLSKHQASDNAFRGRHQNVPSRVWQRRSAILTMLEQQREAEPEDKTLQAEHCVSLSSVEKKTVETVYNFNVLRIQCLPVWASNFSDLGLVEQELDYFSLLNQNKNVS